MSSNHPAAPQPCKELGYDEYELNKALDRVKVQVFLGDNAAFLGSIMSSMEFVWSRDRPTAATDGVTFWWNPDWFMKMHEDARKTVLLHELWHAALLHMVRCGERDPLIWNWACDLRINNGLEQDGFKFTGIENCWKDQQYGLGAEEDIYDVLYQQYKKPPKPSWGPGPCTPNGSGGTAGNQGAAGQPNPGDEGDLGDMIPMTKEATVSAVNNVVKAIHQARLAGEKPGSLPGNIEQIVEKFLTPVIPWEAELQRFFNDLLEEDFSWRRPNRRHAHEDLYLPSRIEEEGRLEHLIYYLDVSGSISDRDILRFNSEVKFIKDQFNPKKLTLVQFDTIIQKEDVFYEDDPFEKIVVTGRGGTCLRCVHAHIVEHKPTAAVIFSDLYVAPMQPLPTPVPIIWACNQTGQSVPFGKLIYVKS